VEKRRSLDQMNGHQRSLGGEHRAEVGKDNHKLLDLRWTDPMAIKWRIYVGVNQQGWVVSTMSNIYHTAFRGKVVVIQQGTIIIIR